MDYSNTTIIVSIAIALTGLVGAITGFASVWFAYLNYSRDNVKIRVKALKNMRTFVPGGESSKESFLVITAANAGRRPVIINKAAFISLKSGVGQFLLIV